MIILSLYWTLAGQAEPVYELISSNNTFKQSHFLRLTVDDGLSSNTITSIVQDPKGYIWIGTAEGLNRYDGTGVTSYLSDQHNEHSLFNNQVNSLAIGVSGQLWIAVKGALLRFNEVDDTFITYRADPDSSQSLLSNDVNTIYVDSHDRLWVGSRKGLSLYQPDTDDFFHYRHDPNKSTGSILPGGVISIREDESGNIWVATLRTESATNNGLSKIDATNGNISNYSHITEDSQSLQQGAIIAMTVTDDGNLWLASSRGGLSQYIPETDSFQRLIQSPINDIEQINVSQLRITSMLYSRLSKFWLATIGNGLVNIDPSGYRLNQYIYDTSRKHSLSANQISAVYEDKANRIWIGTLNRGVNIYDYRSAIFNHVQAELPDNISWNDITEITEVDETRHSLKTDSGQLHMVNLANNQVMSDDQPAQSEQLNLNSRRWYQSRTNQIYQALADGLYEIDQSTGEKVCVLLTEDKDCLSVEINQIHPGLDDTLWLITKNDGLMQFNLDTYQVAAYPYSRSLLSTDTNVVFGSKIRAITLDDSGDLWIATDLGLNKLNSVSGQFDYFIHDPDDDLSLPNAGVNGLYNDQETLWISSDNGLLSLDTRTEKFKRFTVDDGLASNEIRCMLAESDTLWLATDNGLIQWDMRNYSATNFFRENGLQGNEFIEGSCSMSSSGRLYFVGTNGYNYFDPQQFSALTYPTAVAIQSISLDDQKVSFSPDKPLVISHTQDVVQFEFGALDYAFPKINRYQIKLENFDQNWREMGDTENVFYTNLNIGAYTFKVRTINRFGTLSEVDSVDLIKRDHPLRSNWMIGLYVVVTILIISFFVYSSRRKLNIQRIIAERERKVSEQLRNFTVHIENAREEERKYITRELHDELAQILVALKLELRWIESSIQKKKEHEVLERLPEMNNILETGVTAVNDIAKGLRPSVLDDMGLVSAIEAQLVDILDRANISPHFTTNCRNINLPDSISSNIYRIFQEAMSNILKHAEAENIWVTIKRVGGEMILFIRDDGKGIADSDFDKPSSYGLIGIKERVTAMQGEIEIETKQAVGTKIKITLPL